MSEFHDRLDSWKAIAEYLDRDPTTVMRWAKERGLPVYGVPGEGQRHRAVYAYKAEIDAWLKNPAPFGLRVDERKNQGTGAPVVDPNSHELSSSSRPGAGPSLGVSGSTSQTPDSKASAPSRLGSRRSVWAAILGGGLLVALAAFGWLRVPPPEPKVVRFEQLTNDGLEKRLDLVTDGARIYFIENSRDGYVLAEIPSTGGNPVAIARTGVDSHIQDIRPDRSELMLVEDARSRPGAIWILPLPGGAGRRLGNIQAFSAAWSPDGAALAYTTDDGLYLCDANGSNSRRIVAMSGRLASLHWSPDGQQLCFKRLVSKEATLWEVDREGRSLRALLPEWEIPRGETAFWTRDGKYFIFQASHAGHAAPWALRLSRGLSRRHEQATCLGSAGLELSAEAMSRDGARLYCLGRTRGRFQVERFEAESMKFVPYLPDVPARSMDLTRDGKWVAYQDDQDSLWKSRSDGGDKVQLTLPPLKVELPRWSPDGKRIAFMGQDPGQPWKVRVISAEGGPYGPVTSTDASEGAPTWSPDGSRLAFGGLINPADKVPGPLVIHIYDLKERRLSAVPGSEGLWTARWSPEGHYIAALTEDAHNLMLFDFRTGKWKKLLTLGPIWDLHWSRQGKSIYLNAASPEGEPALFRVRIPGHRPEQLTTLKGVSSAGWLGLAPDDSQLLVREINTNEIYALECQFP